MSLSRYRDLFVSEAREHLCAFSSLIFAIGSAPASQEQINELFRRMHSLKGMAATMQLPGIAGLAHALEDLLGRVRERELSFSRPVADLLLTCADTLQGQVDLTAQGGEPPLPDALLNRLRNYSPGRQPDVSQTTPTVSQPAVSAPLSAERPATVRIKTSLLDRLVDLSGELLTVKHRLDNQAEQLQTPTLPPLLQELGTLLRQMRQEVFEARMLPIGLICERLPRTVRDLSAATGKEIRFRMTGDEIELDRSLLEIIGDPLQHLIRNAVDHGLETPAERVAGGKPPEGNLTLAIRRLPDQVELTIQDDGRGIDPARIRAKALAQGLLDDRQAAELSPQESLRLICRPGFSTAATVTELSGRGVGMDVVLSTVQQAGGNLSIASDPGRGCSITLRLPVSIAIIQALLVNCGKLTLALPLSSIGATAEPSPAQITYAGPRGTLRMNAQELPLYCLSQLFRQPVPLPDTLPFCPVLLTERHGRTIALQVDRIIGHQELFIRPLAKPLASLRGLAGSAQLGNGETVFLLDLAACCARFELPDEAGRQPAPLREHRRYGTIRAPNGALP